MKQLLRAIAVWCSLVSLAWADDDPLQVARDAVQAAVGAEARGAAGLQLGQLLLQAGTLDEAGRIFAEAEQDLLTVHGAGSPEVGNSRAGRAMVRLKSGDAAGAVEVWSAQMADVQAITPAVPSAEQADALVQALLLGNSFAFEAGQLALALDLAERAVQVAVAAHGAGTEPVASLHNRIGNTLRNAGQSRDALEHHLAAAAAWTAAGEVALRAPLSRTLAAMDARALGAYDQAVGLLDEADEALPLGERQPDLTRALGASERAQVLRLHGDLEGAVTAASRALELRTTWLGATDSQVGESMVQLAHVLYTADRRDEAIARYAEGVGILEAATHPTDRRLLLARASHASALAGVGRLAEGVVLLEATVEPLQAILPPNHPDLLTLENNLGQLYLRSGRFAEALHHTEGALVRAREVLGTDSDRTQVLMNNLASLYSELGRYDESIALLEELVEVRRRVWGPDHPDVAVSLGHLATARLRSGLHVAARSAVDEALAIHARRGTVTGPAASTALGNLGVLLVEFGALEDGLDLHRRALEALDADPDALAVQRALAMGNIASTLDQLGRPEEAVAMVAEAIPVADAAGEVLLAARMRIQAAQNHVAVGQPERALAALGLAESALPADHPDVVGIWSARASAELVSGGMDAAVAAAQRALAIATGSLGDEHPVLGVLSGELARVLLAADRRAEALPHARRAAEAQRLLGDRLAGGASEDELLAGASHRGAALDLLLELETDPTEAYRQLLAWKGGVLRAVQRRQRDARAASDPATREAVAGLAVLASETGAVLRNPAVDGAQRAARLAELDAERGRLERVLAAAGAEHPPDPPTLEELCTALPRRTAVVDLVRRMHDDRAVYTAFVLAGRACAAPHRVELGDAAVVDAAIARLGHQLEVHAPFASVKAAQLRRLVWDPVEPLLGRADHVVVVPDGALTRVGFAGLPSSTGGYLIERYRFSVAEDAAALLAVSQPVTAGGRALVVGDVNYDAIGHSGPALVSLGMRRGCAADASWGALPGTADEARAIAQAMAGGWSVEQLSGSGADERAVRDAASAASIIHIASHGFFDAAQCGGGVAGPAVSPLSLSGVVLAGANAPTADGDGLWTAAEVAATDLDAARLVVLSACGTGLGQAVDGQGVLGLRRALGAAGADAVVMSLWSVDDAATRDLMTSLYGQLLGPAGGDPVEALHRAQLEALERQRLEGHERWWEWAAFVAEGG